MHSSEFDALTADEIRVTSAAIRAAGVAGKRPGFAAVWADEPDKAALRRGEQPRRRSRSLVLDRETAVTYNVLVDIESASVVESSAVTHGGAPMLEEEVAIATELAKSDQRYVDALALRGITDLSTLQLDTLPTTNREDLEPKGKRLWALVTYHQASPDENAYAGVVEGLIVVVDTVRREVIDVTDSGVKEVSKNPDHFIEERNQPLRDDIKPLHITQPEGVSFQMDGPQLTWQKWRMRINMHPIDGLVLTGVDYLDGGEYRSILHRASLSEMIVPYGDPDRAHYWRNAFDAGEFGMGKLANSLVLGCDCLGEIVYLDAVMADDEGEPHTIPNAVCIHEEDAGILWKHTNWVSGRVDVRRSRKLVVSFISTIGNYHYGFYWNFFQDGHIEVDTKLLGIVQSRALEPGEKPKYATPIAENTAGTYHQHLFNFRLDWEVDGWQNTVVQNDVDSAPLGDENPHGNAIRVTKTPITHELEGDGLANPQTARSWSVINPNKLNAWGQPVSYKLIPGWASDTLIAQHPSPMPTRAGFATKNVWVTPYQQDELHAAGDTPYSNLSPAGLSEWTTANRPVENTDVVLWHTVGVTHIPRSEDWPVMPTEVASFLLVPTNFFDRNPSLDVPPSESGPSGGAACHAPSTGETGASCH